MLFIIRLLHCVIDFVLRTSLVLVFKSSFLGSNTYMLFWALPFYFISIFGPRPSILMQVFKETFPCITDLVTLNCLQLYGLRQKNKQTLFSTCIKLKFARYIKRCTTIRLSYPWTLRTLAIL